MDENRFGWSSTLLAAWQLDSLRSDLLCLDKSPLILALPSSEGSRLAALVLKILFELA
jgi:hypothetical protein